MKKIIVIVLFVSSLAIMMACQSKDHKNKSETANKEIDIVDFKRFIKSKPYTILYFWASWCGISQSGLVNDYSKNYQSLNNDTVQSLLIVASDTNSINRFMENNDINVIYKCLYVGDYPLLIRNIKDGRNMENFVNKMFNHKIESRGFPTILLVDSSFNVLTNSSHTKVAVSNYRYFEKIKNINH